MTNSGGMPVWAYLDAEFAPVAWALVRGTLISVDCVPLAGQGPAGFVSFWHAGIIMSGDSARIFNEGVIEGIRAKVFSHQVSRLRGLYFFANKEEANAPLTHGWGGHFQEKNLLELRFCPAGAVTKVDANWITYAKMGRADPIDAGDTSWIHSYWRGEVCPGREPAWEVIGSGEAVVLDTEVRHRCYEQLKGQFPESEVFLKMAHIAGEVGTRGGLITPFVQQISANEAELRYLLREAEFHDQEVIERIGQHPNAGNLGQLMRDNPIFRTPDLREYFRRFPLNSS